MPWVGRAQEEHDAFAATLTSKGVEVLLLADVLVQALEDNRARIAGIHSAVNERRLGIDLADALDTQIEERNGTSLLYGVELPLLRAAA